MFIFDKKIPEALKRPLFGLAFPHPIGSAPGEDPAGKKFDCFRHCSFIEIGPLAPMQPAPRDKCAGNGDSGWKETIRSIQRHPSRALLACNIAPLTTHPDCESVTRDLLQTFTYLYDFADLFIIDTFRKNKDGVAPLQSAEYLSESMDALIDMRFCYDKYKPILIRVDNEGGLAGLLDYMMYSGLDGIIAGHDSHPLDLVRRIGYFTGGRFPIIAAGGIDTPEKADELLSAGASLLQVEKKYRRTILKHLIGNAH
ncbi:MAG: hypothetical protein IJ654_06745 [Bacteroidales bacterium]|nr:hypothetical protein [Bacteroidales bacterium]